MKGRSGTLITVLGALILLGLVAGYFLVIAPADETQPVVRPGVADACAGDIFDPAASEDSGKSRPGKRDPLSAGLNPGGGRNDPANPGKEGDPAAATDPQSVEKVNETAPVVDPEEVNAPVPGHLLVRVIDKEDERPLTGASVCFPIRGTKLETESGDVKLGSVIAGLARRANRHGCVIWNAKELARLSAEQAEQDAEAGKQPTSLLATCLGYADLFEPLAIPDLKKGAEVTFKLYPAVRVTGKVREKRGGAVQFASVEILQTTGQGDAKKPANKFSIQADALGEFTVKLADSYVYTFHVKMSGYAEYTSREFNFREDAREVSLLLEPARGISGVVVGAGGKPVKDAEVLARDDGDKCYTDAKGKFAFDMVADRIFRNDVNLRVSAEGYAPQNVKVLANDHNVRVELEKEGSLHGVVLSEKNEPIQGAVVECLYYEGEARYPYDAVLSDAKGKFRFGNFAEGKVMITATHGELYSESKITEVQPKKNLGPIKLVLTTGATVSGVVSCNGVGIKGVTIALDGKAAGSTNADGAFTLKGVRPGKHKLKILNQFPIADEHVRQFPVFTTDGKAYYYLPAEQAVELKYADTETVNFEVQSFEAKVDRKITVQVRTRPSEPATGVQVTIKPVFGTPPAGVEAPKTWVTALDLPDGQADMPLNLLNGVSYEATFVHNRFFTARLTADSLAGVQDGGVIELVLERAFIIKGYVKDSQGAGLEGVGLSKDKNNPWDMQATTDIYGYFEFGQLKAGEYTITAFKTSYYQEQRVVKVEASDPEPLQITMVNANEIRIIVANNGTPQPGAHVHIFRNDAEGDNPDDYKRHFDIGTTDAKGEKYINFHWVRNYQIVAYYGNEVAFVNFNNLREMPEREFTIELEQAYDLTGRLVDKDTGRPVGPAIVRAHIASTGVDGRDGNFFQLETDSAGNFAFKVPAGDYWFYVPRTNSHQSFHTEGSTVPAGSTNLVLEVPLREDIEGNYAQVLSISAPATMTAGQDYVVEVTVKNMGSTTWTSAGNKPWRLGSQAPQDNKTWGMSRVPIPQGQEVRPRDTFVFSFTVKAPANAGQYDMQWRMVQDGKEWFGQFSEKLRITVEAPSGG